MQLKELLVKLVDLGPEWDDAEVICRYPLNFRDSGFKPIVHKELQIYVTKEVISGRKFVRIY